MSRRFSRAKAVLLMVTTALAVSLSACASQDDAFDADGTWVGEINTEGHSTTVLNLSGSVWGAAATLSEEASIGRAAVADEYIFGGVESTYLTEDLIYVVDSSVPAVRAYDYDGVFIRSYGSGGQGPGEYARPDAVAADATGRVYVLDTRLRRINVYATSG